MEETQRAVDVLKEKGVYPTFVNARFLKPLDEKLILQLAKSHRCLIIIEEGIKKGGYGEGIESLISENQINTRTLVMAIDNQFIEQGAVEELREKIGIDYKNICEKVLEIIK